MHNNSIGNSGAVDWISTLTFRRVMEVNLFGVVNVTKAFLPLLKKTKGARIVNLSSVAGFIPAPMMAAYDASKHGVEGWVHGSFIILGVMYLCTTNFSGFPVTLRLCVLR